MVDGMLFGDSFEQDQSWDDSGTTISGIQGTHQNSMRVRMQVSQWFVELLANQVHFITFENHSQSYFFKSYVFLRKKSPRQGQGCTTQITELGMHQNHHFHKNPLKINEKNPKINPPSTITIPESAFEALPMESSLCSYDPFCTAQGLPLACQMD